MIASRIRLATGADGAALAAIYAPAVSVHATSFELEPPDADEMARRVEKLTARSPWLVCERNGAVVGYAYAGLHRDRWAYQWSTEVSAYVSDDARRCGVARALYASLFAALVVQGYRNAYAGITLPNPASVGLHESVGFTRVGIYRGIGYKFGAWHDVMWLERPLAPRVPNPALPTLLPVAIADPAFMRALDSGIGLLHFDGDRTT